MQVKPATFFIIGSGRSGSTLLRVMLASHSRIAIPPETWYLIPLLEELPSGVPLTPAQVDRAVAIMTTHYRWPDMGMPAEELRSRAAALPRPTLRDIVEIVYAEHMQAEGKVRWGDKTPGYFKIAGQLGAMYPEARFIHLFRDGRDVVKSFQAVGWYGRRLRDNTKEWNGAIQANAHLSRSPLAPRIFQLRYEDLVLDPEATIGRVCAFLGEEYEPQMLSWEGQLEQMIPAREARIHEKLKRKPRPDDIDRWKREMTPWEILVAETYMGTGLKSLGYERRYNGAWRLLLPFVRAWCSLVLPLVDFQARVLRYARKCLLGAPATASDPK